jgi:hypothetical protein
MSTAAPGNPVQVMSYAEAARILADELDNERITVELFPARNPRFPGHMIRVATGANPRWYRRLALQVSPRHRRPGRCTTGIRRDFVMAALQRIATGRARGGYWERLVMPVVESTAFDARPSA